jgi:hypothetical protein
MESPELLLFISSIMEMETSDSLQPMEEEVLG